MNIRYAAAVLAAATSIVALPVQSAEASYGPWCRELQKQPAYTYKYQGAKVYVPPGKRILKEERPTERDCSALVVEYWMHKYF
jgi:hypothetical protein